MLFGALALGAPAGAAHARAAEGLPLQASIHVLAAGSSEVGAFYRGQNDRPLWVASGRLKPEARRILEMVSGAGADGLDPVDYGVSRLREAITAAERGAPADLARAELLLSQALTAYVRDLRRPRTAGIVYVDADLRPRTVSARAVLDAIAAARSTGAGLAEATRMNPLYESLRRDYAAARRGGSLSADQEGRVRASLERLRALPADLGSRFVLVDAASAQLWMYEDGRAIDKMKVVVGRAGEPTPLMAARIRQLTLNPYWNVPPDLVRRTIAPAVLKHGIGYLRSAGYEALSDWSEGAQVLDPREVDWTAVAAGRTQLAVRQLPGPRNSMGRVKFMFPNEQGVYLHDTPNRDLFAEADRRRSAGCVRLEDAPRLARWLLGRTATATRDDPEQAVPLSERVPVYITYLTAMPGPNGLVFHDDQYRRDRQLLAQLGGGGSFASAR